MKRTHALMSPSVTAFQFASGFTSTNPDEQCWQRKTAPFRSASPRCASSASRPGGRGPCAGRGRPLPTPSTSPRWSTPVSPVRRSIGQRQRRRWRRRHSRRVHPKPCWPAAVGACVFVHSRMCSRSGTFVAAVVRGSPQPFAIFRKLNVLFSAKMANTLCAPNPFRPGCHCHAYPSCCQCLPKLSRSPLPPSLQPHPFQTPKQPMDKGSANLPVVWDGHD